jgi:hypothetical protein
MSTDSSVRLVIRRKNVSDTVEVTVERMSLGQVTDYLVYRTEGDKKTYLGSGTKQEAQRLYDRTKS